MFEIFVAKALFFAIGFFLLGSFTRWLTSVLSDTEDAINVMVGNAPKWLTIMGVLVAMFWFLAIVEFLVFLWTVV